MGGVRGWYWKMRSRMVRLRMRAKERRALAMLVARRDVRLLEDAGLVEEATACREKYRDEARLPAIGHVPDRPRWLA